MELSYVRHFLWRLNTGWKNKMSASESRACIPTLLRTVRSRPLPHTHCLHLDPLKLKMATWSAVRSHTEPSEAVILHNI